MPQELVHISVRRLPVRLLTLVLLLAAGVGSYFAVRWYIGNTMAEYFNTTENNLEVARTAVSLAPDDPLPHWRIAQVSQKILPLDQQHHAILSRSPLAEGFMRLFGIYSLSASSIWPDPTMT